MTSTLAVLGGSPVRTKSWPRWPQPAPGALAALEQVLNSGRWTISGPYQGEQSWERRFAAAFADFNGARFCVPTASGTASLMVGLEACGVGAGDEVIIPGLTWVANASTVAATNAVPVLADIDPGNLCIDPASVEDRITSRTRAIVVVHLYSGLAHLDPLLDVARRHSLAVIEDCAQMHGATYAGRRVGTFGDLGTFSMQDSKALTSGEGGAVVTDQSELAAKLEQLRADGRRYTSEPPAVGAMELVETGEVMGSNRCLSEFHSALLVSQLAVLDEQNEIRRRNLEILDKHLADLGFGVQTSAPGTTDRAVYEYPVLVKDEALIDLGMAKLGKALTAELGMLVVPGYQPLNSNKLYNVRTRRRFTALPDLADRLNLSQYELPVCEDAARRLLTIHHSALLGDENDMRDICRAFEKILNGKHSSPAR